MGEYLTVSGLPGPKKKPRVACTHTHAGRVLTREEFEAAWNDMATGVISQDEFVLSITSRLPYENWVKQEEEIIDMLTKEIDRHEH